MKKRKFWKVALLLASLAVMITVSTVIAFAYYNSRVYLYTDDVGGKKLFRVGMELNTFFDRINSGTLEPTASLPAVADKTPLDIVCTDIGVVKQTNGADDYETSSDGGVTYYENKTSHLTVREKAVEGETVYEYVYNENAEWGSASNPYLISKINHLQNLYVLQNAGYFETSTSEGITEADMPYFLVSSCLGSPVTIDGTGKTFEYIGNNAHPFIGYLGGAFVTEAGSSPLETEVNGQSSTQSAIYNLTVETNDDVTDVGLFGHIGYLGTAPADGETKTFDGAVSTVRDLLLYDVKVRVKDKTLWEALTDTAAHLFSFSGADESIAELLPHDNHHIGILAGHVEYSTVEYISVYYSSDDIAAIDVDMTTKDKNGVGANFFSVSGILGFVTGMNSTQAGGKITIDGIDNDDITVSGGGAGTGGGEESGTGRGYVTAAALYNSYNASGKIVKVTTGSGESQNEYYGLLVEQNGSPVKYQDESGSEKFTTWTLPDGTPVEFARGGDYSSVWTMSASRNFFGRTEVLAEEWGDFVVRDKAAVGTDHEYFYFTGSTLDSRVYAPATAVSDSAVSMKYAASLNAETGDFTRLCKQYERERIGSTLTGWTQATDRYYFYDGVFTFALSKPSDSIEKTWKDGTVDKIVVGQDDSSKWTQDESALPSSVLAFLKPVTTEAELRSGKELFIAYKDGNNYHIVTLAENSTYNAGQQNNAVTTKKTTLPLAGTDVYNAITASLNSGTFTLDPSSYATVEQLKNDWANIQVLDLGSSDASGLTLEQLRNTYQVKVTAKQLDPTSGVTEDDGVTPLSETLTANATANIAGTYYVVSGTTTTSLSGATEVSSAESYGEGFTLFTLEGAATLNLANAQTAIDTSNTVLYENAEMTTALESTLRQNINLSSSGTQISQTEELFYHGYYYFKTSDVGFGWTYHLYKVDSAGNETYIGNQEKPTLGNWENYLKELFSSYSKTTAPDGITLTMVKRSGDTDAIPLLYYVDERRFDYHWYRGYERNTSATSAIGGITNTQASFKDNALLLNITVKYNYIVATQTGTETVYTWNGLSTLCTNVQKYSTVADAAQYETKTLYGKNYDLYQCNQGNKAILVYRYLTDGIILQTMTGSGASRSLVNGSGTKISDVTLPLTDTGRTLTVDGVAYKIYESANGKRGIRAANFKIDGYFTADVKPGVDTTYKLNDTTLLQNDPVQIFELTYPLNNGTETKNYSLYMADGYLAILLIHTEADQRYVYKFWHATSAYQTDPSADPDPYVLQVLRRTYAISNPAGMIVGTNAYVSTASNFSATLAPCLGVSYSTACNVILYGDGTARLEYTLGNTHYYLSYDSSNGRFNSSTSNTSNATKLYLFTAEGTHDSSVGNHVVPIAGTEVGTYPADGYVLWPENVYKEGESATADYNPANRYAQDTAYSLLSLQDLASANWINTNGNPINSSDLYNVFALGDGISDVNMINLWGGNSGTLLGADNYVKAPIGTTGEESYIPTGCVAFRVNSSKESNKIRVIVAVPTSEFFYEQKSGDTYLNGVDYANDYFFCMWKVDEANESTNYSFSVDNCRAAFELPRSAPYNAATAGADYYTAISGYDLSVTGTNNVKKYINVTMNGETYRAYLNGEQVLVAYEFDASEEGVYLLGSTKQCSIVYFSADSTASAGKDGVISYKTGTVDFVYDNGTYSVSESGVVSGTAGDKILTVRDTNKSSTPIEDYSLYYYASLALLYTDNAALINGIQDGDTDLADNGYPNVNNFIVNVRRVATGTKSSAISWQAKNYANDSGAENADAAYLHFVRYAVDSDAVTKRAYAVVTRDAQ